MPGMSMRTRALAFRLFGFLAIASLLLATIAIRPATPASAAPAQVSQSTLNQYRQWMIEARAMYPYPQSVDKMYRVMMCESSGNANVSSPNGVYKGLFQYHTNTWRGNWNPYRNYSLWNARNQIFATAKAWSVGMQGQWECYYLTSGR